MIDRTRVVHEWKAEDFSVSENGANVVWSWGGKVNPAIVVGTLTHLAARVEELEGMTAQHNIEALKKWADSVQVENERLREAVRRYARHEDHCPFYTSTASDGSHFCLCGLSAIFKEMK